MTLGNIGFFDSLKKVINYNPTHGIKNIEDPLHRMVVVDNIIQHAKARGVECSSMRASFFIKAISNPYSYGDIGEYFFNDHISLNHVIMLSMGFGPDTEYGNIMDDSVLPNYRQAIMTESLEYLLTLSVSKGYSSRYGEMPPDIDMMAKRSSNPAVFSAACGTHYLVGNFLLKDPQSPLWNCIKENFSFRLDPIVQIYLLSRSENSYIPELPPEDESEVIKMIECYQDLIAGETQDKIDDITNSLVTSIIDGFYLSRTYVFLPEIKKTKRWESVVKSYFGERPTKEELDSVSDDTLLKMMINDDLDNVRSLSEKLLVDLRKAF